VEDSLNAEFPVDAEDDKGNTLLLLAAQNCNRKLMELCLNRGANINHQNTGGNTALHFAMAYDTEVNTCVILGMFNLIVVICISHSG
jgi:ankyrin repeat protein